LNFTLKEAGAIIPAMANLMVEGGMPLSEEDLAEAKKNEGTLYDWLDGGPRQKEEKKKEKERTPAGDYDTLPVSP